MKRRNSNKNQTEGGDLNFEVLPNVKTEKTNDKMDSSVPTTSRITSAGCLQTTYLLEEALHYYGLLYKSD